MNQDLIAIKLQDLLQNTVYNGSLTAYAVKSIEMGRSNYPVANLITYCKDMNLKVVMLDLTTEDHFYPISVLEVHQVLDLLMQRYEVDSKLVYRKTGIHYTAPKSLDTKVLEEMKAATPLSIKTLLAVCQVIHCNLDFELN